MSKILKDTEKQRDVLGLLVDIYSLLRIVRIRFTFMCVKHLLLSSLNFRYPDSTNDVAYLYLIQYNRYLWSAYYMSGMVSWKGRTRQKRKELEK